MGWIKRKDDEKPKHECAVPMTRPKRRLPLSTFAAPHSAADIARGYAELSGPCDVADAAEGDTWACDTCGLVWVCYIPPNPYKHGYSPRAKTWFKANRRMQRKYGGTNRIQFVDTDSNGPSKMSDD